MKVRILGSKEWEDYPGEDEASAVESFAYDNEIGPDVIIESKRGNKFTVHASVEYTVYGIQKVLPKKKKK